MQFYPKYFFYLTDLINYSQGALKPAKLEIALQATRSRLQASISPLRKLQMVLHLATLPITGGQSHKRRLNHHLQSKNK